MQGTSHRTQELPWLQRMFENIWFLLLIGIILPTISYTAWSLVDLALLPRFDAATVAQAPAGHGPHAASGVASTPAAAGDTVTVTVTVDMKDMAFQTELLTIEVGTNVAWVNQDLYPHSVAYGTPETPESKRLFASSGDFGTGDSFAYTFETPGVHEIYCATPGHYQAGMTMTVVVEEASR